MRKKYEKPEVKRVIDLSRYGLLLMQDISGVKVESYNNPGTYIEDIGYGGRTDDSGLLFSRESSIDWDL